MDAIRRAQPRQLLIVADGPRADHPGDAELCRQARAVAEQVDWDCTVEKDYATQNLGCRLRVASGLAWVFSRVPEAIILEDDCVPHSSFFPFCAELLARYRDDPRVHAISGTNLLFGRSFTRDSYYFSRFYHVWGWASWARAWKHFDIEMRRWPELRRTDWVERYLGHPGQAALARYFFDETLGSDRFTGWDYQWVLSSWLQGAHSITPSVNLVTNIGFGEMAAHMRDSHHPLANLPASAVGFPLRHPARVEVLSEADRHEWAALHPHERSRLDWRSRWARRAKRLLGWIAP